MRSEIKFNYMYVYSSSRNWKVFVLYIRPNVREWLGEWLQATLTLMFHYLVDPFHFWGKFHCSNYSRRVSPIWVEQTYLAITQAVKEVQTGGPLAERVDYSVSTLFAWEIHNHLLVAAQYVENCFKLLPSGAWAMMAWLMTEYFCSFLICFPYASIRCPHTWAGFNHM